MILGCAVFADPSSTTYILDFPITTNGGIPSIAVYAALVGVANTDRAPNDGFYQITSVSSINPNMFQDIEPAPVGGITVPVNKLELIAPYLALAGLIAAVSTVYVFKRRKD